MMGEERFNSFMREVPIIYLLCKLLDQVKTNLLKRSTLDNLKVI